MSAIAIIPAKGTSRRVPGKNRRMFHGHPIIYYSINAAQDSGLFSRIVVSTDDDWIGRYSEGCGATWFTRVDRLTKDDVGTQEVAADVLYQYGDYEFACVIYATAPMMMADDLRFGFDVMRNNDHYAFTPGWFYWGKTEWFLQHRSLDGAHEIRTETIAPTLPRYIDINTPEDWVRAELMYAALHKEEA